MKKNKDSEEAQRTGCGMLLRHFRSVPVRSVLSQAGTEGRGLGEFEKAVDAVLTAMLQYTESAAVQEQVFGVLAELASKMRVAIGTKILDEDQGGIKLVLAAIRVHAGNMGIVRDAFKLLDVAGSRDVSSFVQQFVAAEGSQAVVAAMKHDNNREAAEVFSLGCGVLTWLAAKDNEGMIVRDGGVEAALVGMRTHKRELRVQNAACKLFETLVAGCEDSPAKTRIAQGAEVLLARIGVLLARIEDQGNLEEVRRLSALLVSVAVNQDNRRAIVEQGGIQVTVKAMRKTAASESQVQGDLCCLLSSLLVTPPAPPHVASSGPSAPTPTPGMPVDESAPSGQDSNISEATVESGRTIDSDTRQLGLDIGKLDEVHRSPPHALCGALY